MAEPIEKLDMQSPDFVNQNIEKLAKLFPNCVTESATGKAIDFDLLKQELNHAVVEGNKERYRLEWPGKREAIVTANLPTTKTLRPVREDSVDFDATENIYIEGDNLEVLKLLQESYLGKIKMIYIDPPYNTGNDFVYKDNFSKDKDEELLESGQKDEHNQRLVLNPETAGRYHSDWLNLMYPRLKLARNLLNDEGVIFISIDDNEIHNLRKICDDIFGEFNQVTEFIWEKKYTTSNNIAGVSNVHEYIVCYCKDATTLDSSILRLSYTAEAKARYKNPDNDPRGPWMDVSYHGPKSPIERPNLNYPLIHPKTKEEIWPKEKSWAYEKNNYMKHEAENMLYWGKEFSYSEPRLKRFLTEMTNGMVPKSLLTNKDVGGTSNGRDDLRKLFPELDMAIFDNPKPVSLLKHIMNTGLDEKQLVLDFFSGSGSLAQAVYELNANDNAKRKFILVQLPESTEAKSEAYSRGYKNICEIGKERIRRAAKKIKEETNADIDYGFRVYRLDESNMQDVYYRPQDYDQAKMDLFGDNVKSDRTEDDLLAQVMLDWGLPLSLKIEQANVAGKKVFKVAENSLFACFDRELDEAFAKEIAKEKPLRIVFKDAGFKDDTAKTNVKQLLKQLSPETEMKVL